MGVDNHEVAAPDNTAEVMAVDNVNGVEGPEDPPEQLLPTQSVSIFGRKRNLSARMAIYR